MVKLCARCKESKPLSDFYINRGGGRVRPHSYCKVCFNVLGKSRRERKYNHYIEASREYYKKNRESLLKKDREKYRKNASRMRERHKELLRKRLQWYESLKTQLSCVKCGESHPACLHFHHRDSKQKLGTIGAMVRSLSREQVEKEIAKCDVLCANCHAKIHWEERQNKTKDIKCFPLSTNSCTPNR